MLRPIAACIGVLILILPIAINAQIQNPRDTEYNFKTDTTKRIVDLSEFILLLPRESFPIIDYPSFVGIDTGMRMFFEHEPVISVEIDGQAKAYPLAMLTRHEMANDTLSGIPILPTYCPLCNASIVYDRRFGGGVLEFEVSGMLRKSDMVMFDRQTETWWQQLEGHGLVGDYAGEYLNVIPSLVISVEEFFTTYPDGRILSTNTGTGDVERYANNPYVSYDSIGNNPYGRFFDAANVDDRLPAMERVVDVRVEDDFKIYAWSDIASKGVLHDDFNGLEIVIFHKKGTVSVMDAGEIRNSKDIGSVTVFSPIVNGASLKFKARGDTFIDRSTKSVWDITGACVDGPLKGEQLRIIPHGNHFAFAWLAFHPETEIYGQ